MTADNFKNTNEFILTINYSGAKTQGYGGTTFMTHASVGGSMPSSSFGIGGGWGGIRTTSALVNQFPANTNNTFPNNGNPDTRAEFWTQGQTLAINDVTSFTDGYAVTKFRNVNSDGTAPSSTDYSDVDMPIFRLAEQYLIYAEASVRTNGDGKADDASLTYVNNLRKRAYGNDNGNVTKAQVTKQFILDERARELYWEGLRRSDLIRYGLFTSANYVWPFKGGVKGGAGVADFRNLYPIPDQDRSVNPNLKQNPGY
jgi:hypothetical protein